MRRMFLFICLVFSTHCGKSQVLISLLLGDKLNTGKLEFGLEGGLNWSNLNGLAYAKNLTGFNLGFYFDLQLKNPAWMFNTGVIVKSPMGAGDLPVFSLDDADTNNVLTKFYRVVWP